MKILMIGVSLAALLVIGVIIFLHACIGEHAFAVSLYALAGPLIIASVSCFGLWKIEQKDLKEKNRELNRERMIAINDYHAYLYSWILYFSRTIINNEKKLVLSDCKSLHSCITEDFFVPTHTPNMFDFTRLAFASELKFSIPDHNDEGEKEFGLLDLVEHGHEFLQLKENIERLNQDRKRLDSALVSAAVNEDDKIDVIVDMSQFRPGIKYDILSFLVSSIELSSSLLSKVGQIENNVKLFSDKLLNQVSQEVKSDYSVLKVNFNNPTVKRAVSIINYCSQCCNITLDEIQEIIVLDDFI